tara:strand:- start:17 stop:184 length:168 start_codon:yes stop_codon:yes gene_type:complete
MSDDSKHFFEQLVQIDEPLNWLSIEIPATKSSGNSTIDFETYDEFEALDEIFVGM